MSNKNIKERLKGAIVVIISILAVIGLKNVIGEVLTELQLRGYRKNKKKGNTDTPSSGGNNSFDDVSSFNSNLSDSKDLFGNSSFDDVNPFDGNFLDNTNFFGSGLYNHSLNTDFSAIK